MYWIKLSQSTLVKHNKFKICEKQFDFFIDEHGIIRCGGRLTNANVEFSVKHPIVLNTDHHITRLIVEQAH